MNHQDPKLNLLRYLAFGAVGFYLYKTYRSEGSLGSALGSGKLSIDTDKMVDTAMPWIELPPAQKELVREGVKSFAKNLKDELVKKGSKK